MTEPALSILHVDTETAWRGGQQALLSLVRELLRRGHRQKIACPPVSELAEAAQAAGVPTIALRDSRGLRQELLAGKFQILHAHSGRAQNLAYLSSLGIPLRRVVTRHVTFAPKYPWIHRQKYSLTCDGIIAVSGAVRGVLEAAGVNPEKIVVIHTGVEIPDRLPDRDAARARLGLNLGDFVAGHLGAFTSEKGQDVAVEAMRSVSGVRLLLGGEGPTLSKIREQARGLDVAFPGFQENRGEFYAALDVFLMPSRSEAWGLAALEAMAYGVPVIASATGGLNEMIEDGESGLLVPPGNPGALAKAIDWVLSHAAELRSLGDRGRERAAHFSMEKTAAKTEEFYRSLLRANR